MNDMKEVKIMKNMKRTLTLLLAAMMILTLTPFTAFAENGAAEEQRELIVGSSAFSLLAVSRSLESAGGSSSVLSSAFCALMFASSKRRNSAVRHGAA